MSSNMLPLFIMDFGGKLEDEKKRVEAGCAFLEHIDRQPAEIKEAIGPELTAQDAGRALLGACNACLATLSVKSEIRDLTLFWNLGMNDRTLSRREYTIASVASAMGIVVDQQIQDADMASATTITNAAMSFLEKLWVKHVRSV